MCIQLVMSKGLSKMAIETKVQRHWQNETFSDRIGKDRKRILSYELEKDFILENLGSLDGKVLDIGCGAGFFLKTISWTGEMNGVEINEKAKKIAIKNGYSFERDLNDTNYFDAIIMRGSVHLIPHPFLTIEKCYNALKPGGKLFILASPNSDSIIHRLFGDMHIFKKNAVNWRVSKNNLKEVCENFGFIHKKTNCSYLKSPYRNLISDHFKFIKLLTYISKDNKFSFWGNTFDACYEKPK